MNPSICTLPKKEANGIWRELVDAASLVAILQAAVFSDNDPPEPEDIHLLLGIIRHQLLNAANRVDRARLNQHLEESDGC